jgi:uncharacterized protein YndB with AHSA1/START domain
VEQNDQAGRVEIKDNRATITFTRSLRHPPNAVWEALTSPQEFSVWYNGNLAIDGRIGGLLEVFPGEFHWSGPILRWEPPNVLEYEHNHAPCKVMPTGENTIVRWELEPSGEGTTLTFTQSRLKRTFGFAPIMHVFLERLEAHLNGQPIPDNGHRFHEVKSLYPVWNAKKSERAEVLP